MKTAEKSSYFNYFLSSFTDRSFSNFYGIYQVCGMFCEKKFLKMLRNLQSLRIVLREKVSWNVAKFTKFAECFALQSYLNCCGIYQVCGLFCVKKFLEMSWNIQSLRNVLLVKVAWIVAEFTNFTECFACKSFLNCCGIYKGCGMFYLIKLREMLRNLQRLRNVFRETVTEITKFTNSKIYIRKIKIENNSDDKINLINNLPSDNSGLAQLGFRALSKLVLYLEVRSLIYTLG